MDQRLVKNCLAELKQALRRQGIAYAEVAERMEVSEVTVKRMLNGGDISLGRLSALAELAGWQLSELIAKAEARLPEVRCFTEQQDQTFVRYPHLFQYFLELHQNQLNPQAVAEERDLDELSTYLYLRKLEDMGLVTVLPGNKVRAPANLFTFAVDSQFVKKGVAWSLEQATRALLDRDDDVADLSMLFLPENLYQQFLTELETVFRKFADRQADQDWGWFKRDDVRQLVTFGYPVKSQYPVHEIIRLKDGDLGSL